MDWKASIDYWKQVTHISWYFDTYGPYVSDVVVTAKENPELFTTMDITTYCYNTWKIIGLKSLDYSVEIQDCVVEIYDFIIEKTKNLNFSEFIDFVYSTYPIQVSSRYSYLDLPKLAKAYKLS